MTAIKVPARLYPEGAEVKVLEGDVCHQHHVETETLLIRAQDTTPIRVEYGPAGSLNGL